MTAREFIAAIVGDESSGFVEVRHRQPDGVRMAQRFFGAGDLDAAADYVLSAGTALDTYVGMAPRVRQRGRSEDVERAWIASADCDDDGSVQALARFTPAPSIVLRSGSQTAKRRPKLHAHWLLREPIDRAALEGAKRKLAHALGSDGSIVDAARIMRVPGTLNFKASPPQPVAVEHADAGSRFSLAEIVGSILVRVPAPVGSSFPGERGQANDDALLEIPANEYVPLLSGRALDRAGKVACPFHDDGTPSLHAYADASRGWYCFGCRVGGTIYDFAGLLWFSGQSSDVPLRGRRFVEVRERLMAMFFGEDMAA